MGMSTMQKAGARLGGLSAALAVAGSVTMSSAAAHPSPPNCEGPYSPGAICTSAEWVTGEYYATPLPCDNKGRHYVDNVSMDTSDGPVGWYTWSCDRINAGGEELWSLSLFGFAYK